MLSAGFKALGPQPPVPPPPPYRLPKVSPAESNMTFHNNKLVEVPLFEPEVRRTQSPSPPPSRTPAGDFVTQEETADKKRKRMEADKFQILHRQSAVDAARAADMDDIHFTEPYELCPFPPNNAFDRRAPFYSRNAYHSWAHDPRNGGAFYNDGIPGSSDLSQSLSGETLVPHSFVAGPYDAPEPLYEGGTDRFHVDAHTFHADVKPYHDDADTLRGASDSYHDDAEHYSGGLGPAYQVGNHNTFSSDVDASYRNDADLFMATSFAAGLGEANQAGEPDENFTQEDTHDGYAVSANPNESDFTESESEDERPRKLPKLNKDGAPRKPRQPRAKLLKWTDDDWKNVCLGIVWACGENGVQIPFEQAAQVVGVKCTAGALQQALLKLRGKQIANGHQIPSLRMAWTRKNKYAAAKASQEPEANKLRKRPTRVESTQSLFVNLRRAYSDRDRQGMARPYKWKKPSRKARSSAPRSPANIKQEDVTAESTYTQIGGMYDYGIGPQTPSNSTGYLPATPAATPFSQHTGYLHGMAISGEEYASLLTTEGLHELGNGFADASDDVFSI